MRRREPVRQSIPNLAPMVDVIMVLLVFFLLGASLNLIKQGVLQTELNEQSGPSAGAAVQINPMIRIALEDVNQGESARIYVMEEPLADNTFDGLLKFLQARRRAGADPKNMIVIGAETTVRWRYVIKAMDAAVRAGFSNVQFAVSFRAAGASGPGGQ
jgi:biopolymer transport protein ExbD